MRLQNYSAGNSRFLGASFSELSGSCCATSASSLEISGSYWRYQKHRCVFSYIVVILRFNVTLLTLLTPKGNSDLKHLGVRRVTRVSSFLVPLTIARALKHLS